ncbi:MAG: carboxypeptidase-like regulatory domain-containing protein [Candidatus Eisenbacteria bacterium]|nr:carboxypeptidase-like regulatory domain-containing protein [Candidatus Eisenbacteria bacterium]
MSASTPSRGFRRGLKPALGLALGLSLALHTGCDEDPPFVFSPPPPDAGLISGAVLTGGEPIRDVAVGAYALGTPQTTRYRTRTDVEGVYELQVPAGDYELRCEFEGREYLWSASGPRLRLRDTMIGDTLRASRAVAPRADFRFGRLLLRIRMSPLSPTDVYVHANAYFVDEEDSGAGHLRSIAGWNGPPQGEIAVAEFERLPPGKFLVSVRAYDRLEWWLPGVRRTADADTIIIGSQTEVRDVDLSGEPCRLRGWRRGAWRDAGYSAEFVAVATDGAIADDASMLADSFEFRFLRPEPVRLRLTIDDVERWIGGTSFEDATVFVPVAGETVTVPRVDDALLLIRLVEPGAPALHGVRFRVVEESGRTVVLDRRYPEGDLFLIPNLLPGWLRFQVEPLELGMTPWVAQWFDGADSLADAVPIRLDPEDGPAEATVRLRTGGVARGRIRSSGSVPRYGRLVLTHAGRREVWAALNEWETDGSFGFIGVPDGRYKVGCCSYSFSSDCDDPFAGGFHWFGDTASWDSAAVVSVRQAETIDGIEIWTSLPPP